MAKTKKLTKSQQRRIKANHDKKLDAKHLDLTDKILWNDGELGPAEHGIIISRFGQHADVENSQGQIFRCNLRS